MKQENKTVLDPATVDHIAELSRLFVPEEERAALLRDMETILAFAGRIAEVENGYREEDRQAVPFSHLRADEPAPSLSREELLRSAPAEKDGFFVVPSVMEG